MLQIQSKTTTLLWNIQNRKKLSKKDKEFIENLNPCIYHNDLSSKLWIFDRKLPSGKWLTTVYISNDLKNADAFLYE